MTNWIFLLSTLAVVNCRPQNTQETSAVEIEKQHVIEITPRQLFETNDQTQKELEDSTKEILEKIALVNEKQGLNKKKPRPHYQHFPFSYLRSQDSRQRADFKFPRDPFTNPILDYIERKQEESESSQRTPVTTQLNVLEDENEVPTGQYIKRKVIHQQTMIVPGPSFTSGGFNPPPPPQASIPQSFYTMSQSPSPATKPEGFEMKKSELEKQTINNIKNIVENSQYTTPMVYNPYLQQYNPYFYQQIQPRQSQWPPQWPFAQYFPIIIKDPLTHMFNAMTTMIEYGPQAGQGNKCKHLEVDRNKEKKAREISMKPKMSYNVVDNGKGTEIIVSNEDDSNLTTVLEIEDLQITDNREDAIKRNLNFRESKQNQEIMKTFFYNTTRSPTDPLSSPLIQTLQITKSEVNSNDTSRQSPPIRDQELGEDELELDELEKAEDVQVSHDGNKKLFSKDNTGSGIFVHKIKVRKGGVAIAGPGGIATAGSGGTAIVGPNGFAYTHPDSLAIAGSGTKVVAVEPTINLATVVNDHKNKTRGQGHAAPSRLGKVVAVGPVIYYNKG
ncbi:uncharacterized protein LOC123013267 isoform X1 [Tribolium madens]|uniref:uncharacterized protein LOC123013267 isoform X1 n=1 Tax=Tribolium madens TaxID=41895 RepID=UPI001CF720E5|nr:uncharacterized protein LOC123013267 isoform X1 [Tribolium madens]